MVKHDSSVLIVVLLHLRFLKELVITEDLYNINKKKIWNLVLEIQTWYKFYFLFHTAHPNI